MSQVLFPLLYRVTAGFEIQLKKKKKESNNCIMPDPEPTQPEL